MMTQQKTTQLDLHQSSCQEQATKLMWKVIALQQQATALLKQATLLEMQATALLTEQSDQPFRNCQEENDAWDEWVAARFIPAGDA